MRFVTACSKPRTSFRMIFINYSFFFFLYCNLSYSSTHYINDHSSNPSRIQPITIVYENLKWPIFSVRITNISDRNCNFKSIKINNLKKCLKNCEYTFKYMENKLYSTMRTYRVPHIRYTRVLCKPMTVVKPNDCSLF